MHYIYYFNQINRCNIYILSYIYISYYMIYTILFLKKTYDMHMTYHIILIIISQTEEESFEYALLS